MSTPSLYLPALSDDVIIRILILFQPDDPAGLVRASLACKHWRSILTDAGFLRRYRQSHRTPPRLGLIHNNDDLSYKYGPIVRFIPTCSFRPATPERRGSCIAVRHGRVLLKTAGSFRDLAVWDPVTDEKWALPPAPSILFSTVVLCAAPGCDHLDCHGRPFAVALVGRKLVSEHNTICAHLYTSEAGEWSEQAELVLDHLCLMDQPGVFVGDAVYFTSCKTPVIDRKILKYDMGRGELALMDLPPPPVHHVQPDTMLTATHDGELRLVDVDGSTLRLWSREADRWTVRAVVEPEPAPVRLQMKGFAPCAGEIFVDAGGVLYSVELESGRPSKAEEPFQSLAGPLEKFTPYESFYTPGKEICL